jgi:hypothetical protein
MNSSGHKMSRANGGINSQTAPAYVAFCGRVVNADRSSRIVAQGIQHTAGTAPERAPTARSSQHVIARPRIIRTGVVVGTSARGTGTSPSTCATPMAHASGCSSTGMSCRSSSAVRSTTTRRCITRTATAPTTGPRTWSCGLAGTAGGRLRRTARPVPASYTVSRGRGSGLFRGVTHG